jgi:hypothetical protein
LPEYGIKLAEKDTHDLGEFSIWVYFDMFFLRIAKEMALAARY